MSGWYTQSYSIGKNNWLSFSLSCQLWIAFWLGVFCAHFPFSVLGLCVAWASADILHTLAIFVSSSSYCIFPCCIWKMLSLWSHSPPLVLTVFLLLFHIPEPWDEEYEIDIPSRAEISQVRMLISSGFLCWLPSTPRNFSGEDRGMPWSANLTDSKGKAKLECSSSYWAFTVQLVKDLPWRGWPWQVPLPLGEAAAGERQTDAPCGESLAMEFI